MKIARPCAPQSLAVLTGVLLTLSFPPFSLSFLAWFAWIPLWVALERTHWQHGFRLGYITGLIYTLGTLNWIANNRGTNLWVAGSSMAGTVLYLSLYFGLYGYLIARGGRILGRRVVWIAPVLYVGVEYLFSWGFMGFPWLSLAMTQYLFLPIQQLAELGGIYLISFWVMLINAAIYEIEFREWPGKTQLKAWIGLALFIAVSFGYGGLRMWMVDRLPSPTIKIGVIQSNVDPIGKWARDKKLQQVDNLLLKTDQSRVAGARIIVWPETAVPAYLMYYPALFNRIQNYAIKHRISILTGSLHHERRGAELAIFNSAFFFTPAAEVHIYHKQHLVPFAERLPLVDVFPQLKILNFGQANFTSGTKSSVFQMGQDGELVKMGTTICYESSDPVLFRRFVKNGAQVMSIITNDGWLGRSIGPYQHLAVARLRAIEHRIPIVRSAQTGISAYIRPDGVISHSIPLNQAGYFVVAAPLKHPLTLYTRWGDWFGILMLCGMLGMTVWFILKRGPHASN